MLSKVNVYCDGASRGNPGRSSIGVVIYDSDMNIIERYKEFIGKNTNNFAEYSSLIKALKLASKFTDNEVNVFMDSELVVKQLLGKYKVKQVHLKILFDKVKINEKLFSKVNYKNVPRENIYQQEADKLANEALDS
ncbi:ribonuclease HI family protein [Candidatus Woesearchaeota archaeon]|nr:MAG: ribonuclease H [archaeon GW2011_AR18]MBS3162122.1 ribonuclease HI family protein [Candidatus Woesearchaeota archaeon]HIH25248.1 ribonuclease HI family protein [Nanoarchaeota archaeon]